MAGNITNPATPFTANLSGAMSEGKSVTVTGYVPLGNQQNRFSINFACSPKNEPKDIALHFNPRFNESCVVRNSKQNGNWGTEERHGSFPFQKMVPFEITICAMRNCYRITLNGQFFCDFNHRIPMQNVNTVAINQDIKITAVRFDGFPDGYAKPPPYEEPGYNPLAYPGSNQPIYNPPVPLIAAIPGNLHPGKMINIKGVPHPNCSRFTVNLQCGTQPGKVDVGLHFDVRMNYQGQYNTIVRNVKMHGQWGQEEKHVSHFPFSPNVYFEMLILCEANAFKIAVNNQHFTEFHHRLMPLNRINTLHINGDIRLDQIRFQ